MTRLSGTLRLAAGFAACMLALTVAGSAAADSGTNPSAKTLSAVKVNGEVYVKAEDVIRELGGSGMYDEQTGSFLYAEEDDVPSVIEGVSPAVVAIIGRSAEANPYVSERNNLMHGTGVVVRQDGWIMTNAHVVKDMKDITVVTADGKTYAGKRTHIDEDIDLAIVKIEKTQLPTATFSTRETKVGETVIAIGTPISFALRNSVSVGVVSGVQRSIYSNYVLLQTDAAINPGNSGGPLVNMDGEIVGINTLKFTDIGVESLGFSIPADTAAMVLDHFVKFGKVKKASLELDLQESWAATIGLPTDEPLKVNRALKDGAGEEAGIKAGDLIYSINKTNVHTIVDVNELLKGFLPGDKVTLMVVSNGNLVQRTVTLGEKN